MSSFNDYFQAREAGVLAHPKLRRWKAKIPSDREPGDVTCEVDRPETMLGFEPAKLRVCFRPRDGGRPQCEETDWSEELNDGLIDLGVQAASTDNEVVRFTLGLRDALGRVERQYGDGFYNAVLVEWVGQSPFAGQAQLRELLPMLRGGRPYRGPGDSTSYQDCRSAIQEVLHSAGIQLVQRLRYSQRHAESILSAALTAYLDERFSVSVGKRFGWR